MSITRISTFEALNSHIKELQAFLTALLPVIRGSAGCLSCQLLQDQHVPTRMLMIEVWESVEAHQESLRHVPHEHIERVRHMLASPPAGSYYR